MNSFDKIEATSAETSIAPIGFTNAPPFPRRKQRKDPIRTMILVAATVAMITFLVSMILVALLSVPEV
jgi:hypothetical protein